MIDQGIIDQLQLSLDKGRKVSFLVGAGISAESGIPTFRGKDGYWVSGSKNYKAQEIGTKFMYNRDPQEVWKWYLYRKSVTDAAEPNTSHHMLRKLEDHLGDQFVLISQNVDGLHRKVGNSEERTHYIHGDMDFVRCGFECTRDLYPFPKEIPLVGRNKDVLPDEEWELLKCPKCGRRLRPHVLWFDEYYNEHFYRQDTVLAKAKHTGILFILGTSGATHLPHVITATTLSKNGMAVEVNIDDTNFSDQLRDLKMGMVVRGKSSEFLTELTEIIQELTTKKKTS